MSDFVVRPMSRDDLPAIATLQSMNAEAAQWEPSEYLLRESYVACFEDRVAGFLVIQPLLPDEAEVINIAVHPGLKRLGIGRRLLDAASVRKRTLHLEVRQSNAAARAFYGSLGFVENGCRRDYYRE